MQAGKCQLIQKIEITLRNIFHEKQRFVKKSMIYLVEGSVYHYRHIAMKLHWSTKKNVCCFSVNTNITFENAND